MVQQSDTLTKSQAGFQQLLLLFTDIFCNKALVVYQLCVREVDDHLKRNSAFQDGAFFRFQPIFKEEILLDETDNQTLIEMMWDTKVIK